MSQELWTSVDRYLGDLFVAPDPALDAVQQSSAAAGLPPIAVSPLHGKFLHILARLQGAKRILEIGTLAGYSTICLARALPAGGRLITLEIDPGHAQIAAANIARANLSHLIDIRLGAALETLPKLAAEKLPPFDLIFIDADKVNIPDYFQWALKLSHPGSLILVDNVIRKGAILDPGSKDEAVIGVRRFNEMLANEKRVTTTTLQTVGQKGHDGLALILVN